MKKRNNAKLVDYTVEIENPIVEMLEYVAARDGVTARDIVIVALVDALMKLSQEETVLSYTKYLIDEAKSKRKAINTGVIIGI
jgi:hypothetical protein